MRNYLLRGGIRDGKAGLAVSLLNSTYVLMKHVKLLELELVHVLHGPEHGLQRQLHAERLAGLDGCLAGEGQEPAHVPAR